MNPEFDVPYARAYLEFSDGLIIDEVSTDSCSWLFQSGTGISHDSMLFAPSVLRPSHELQGFIGFHLLFYGYDSPSFGAIEDHEVVWNNINKNDHSLINQEPYKMNFLLEYVKDPDSWNNSRYLNSHNGNFIGGFGPPYSTDEGNMRLTNVRFTDTEYNAACTENYGGIRFEADLSGDLYNRDYTDTISVSGSIDLFLLTRIK